VAFVPGCRVVGGVSCGAPSVRVGRRRQGRVTSRRRTRSYRWSVHTRMEGDGRKNILARTFSIDPTMDPLSLLARAKRAAKENAATLVGDKESGRFSHDMVTGEYRMVGQTVIVTITDTHWLIPWPIVESRLRELSVSYPNEGLGQESRRGTYPHRSLSCVGGTKGQTTTTLARVLRNDV
jgi:hypothetical protein